MIDKLYQDLSAILWNFKHAIFNPKTYINSTKDLKKLRLIVGPGRSGTTWISSVLSGTETPIRSIMEPIYPLKLRFSIKNDKSSISYGKNFIPVKSIVKLFSFFSQDRESVKKIFSKKIYKLKVLRDDKDFEKVIIKEVHCLLALEDIIKHIKSPVLVVTRNIIDTIDSQLSYSGFYDPVFVNEIKYINSNSFINKYFPERKKKIRNEVDRINEVSDIRDSIIQKKAICVKLINDMLIDISIRNKDVLHISYEDFCTKPERSFVKAAKHLQISFSKKAKNKLLSTQSKKNEKYQPNSIYRDTKKQLNKMNKFLTKEEENTIKSIIKKVS